VTATLTLERLRVPAHLGCDPAERAASQPVWATLVLRFRDPPAGATTDELAGTVDYDELARVIRTVADEREYRLIEHFTLAVHTAVRGRLPENVRLEITLTKQAPIANLEGGVSFTLADD